MLPTVHCLTSSHAQGEQIFKSLHEASIPPADISYVRYSGTENTSQMPAKEIETNTDSPGEKTAGGVTAGAVAGAAAGVGVMSIVGLTPLLIIAPAIVTAGAAIGASTGTAMAVSGLDDYGVPEAEHSEYEHKLRDGGALVAVRTEDEAKLERAGGIMEQAGSSPRLIRLTRRLD